MKCSEKSMLLYGVTGGNSKLPLFEQVKAAIAGGITFLQLREKNRSSEEIAAEALKLKVLCATAGIPFVINDDVKAAAMADIDGVHIGQSDMFLTEARHILGPDKIIGVSAHTVEEALAAERGGADYLGVGAMFATATKSDAELVSFDTLKDICSAVRIPVVAIGGINETNLSRFQGSGADGVAIVSAIFSAADIQSAARRLKAAAECSFR